MRPGHVFVAEDPWAPVGDEGAEDPFAFDDDEPQADAITAAGIATRASSTAWLRRQSPIRIN